METLGNTEEEIENPIIMNENNDVTAILRCEPKAAWRSTRFKNQRYPPDSARAGKTEIFPVGNAIVKCAKFAKQMRNT